MYSNLILFLLNKVKIKASVAAFVSLKQYISLRIISICQQNLDYIFEMKQIIKSIIKDEGTLSICENSRVPVHSSELLNGICIFVHIQHLTFLTMVINS